MRLDWLIAGNRVINQARPMSACSILNVRSESPANESSGDFPAILAAIFRTVLAILFTGYSKNTLTRLKTRGGSPHDNRSEL